MPTLITPNEVDRKRRDLDDHDHGGGGRKPPTDKRTGGGGDPENWKDRQRARQNPRERLIRYRLGLFFALSAVFMFFVAIVGVFFVSQGSGRFDANARFINEWLPTTIPPILYLNTFALIVSSLTVEIARRHMFHEIDVMDEWLGYGKPTSRRAMPWMAITLALGTLFVVGQLVAWHQLAEQRVLLNTSPSSHSFYLITAAHGAHLLLGLFALGGTIAGLIWSRVQENRQIMVDCAAWYWHSMGLLWVALFALLRFCQ